MLELHWTLIVGVGCAGLMLGGLVMLLLLGICRSASDADRREGRN